MPDDSAINNLFERMSDPAVVLDGGGRVLAVNPAFAALAASPQAAMKEREWSQLFTADGGPPGVSPLPPFLLLVALDDAQGRGEEVELFAEAVLEEALV